MLRIMTLILIILALSLAGCGTSQIEQGVSATDFDKVEINNGFHVDIIVGEEYSVTLKAAEDILEDVEAVRDGDTLKIRVKPLHDIGRAASLKAEVTMPSLTALTLNGGSWVTVTGSGNDVTLKFTSGSHADLDNFKIANADLTVSGGSHVSLNVNGKLDVEVSGGSHVTYSGDPQIGDIDLSSGSTFSKK